MIKTESPKNIVFMVTGLSTGGAEMMLLKLCSEMDSSRFKISIISLSNSGSIGSRIQDLGIPVYAIEMRPGRPSLVGLFKIRRIIKKIQPDLIQGWMYHGNLVATLVGGSIQVCWGIRQSFYGLSKERWLTGLVIRLSAIFSRSPVMTIYNSHTSARQHREFGFDAGNTKVIPNGFDTNEFCPSHEARLLLRNELGICVESIVIGLIGRFHEMKDHENFFNAASLIANKFPSIYFLLAGSRIDSNNLALISMIKDRHLIDKVFLLGERTDMPQLNAALDIATSASAWGEGFANTIGEAMSCGVPCVVTNVGDSAWVVCEGGMIVSPRDSRALAAAWENLIQMGENERHIIGLKARNRVIKEFSLGSVARQYESAYDLLITKVGKK